MMRKMVLLMIGVLLVFGLVGCMSEEAMDDMVTQRLGIYSPGKYMVYVPPMTFPIGEDNSGTATVTNGYYIGRTEVTYRMWKKVFEWSVGNGYFFANAGMKGNDGAGGKNDFHPVTTINWRDAMVWCNAATQWHNAIYGTSYTSVYYTNAGFTNPIKDSRDGSFASDIDPTVGSFDNPYVKTNGTGFRLPTEWEWELAARFIRDINNDGELSAAGEFYPGNYYSGANDDIHNQSASLEVAWLDYNTHEVGLKKKNALGLYDMGGNVHELCWLDYIKGSYIGYRSLQNHFDEKFYSSEQGFRMVRQP